MSAATMECADRNGCAGLPSRPDLDRPAPRRRKPRRDPAVEEMLGEMLESSIRDWCGGPAWCLRVFAEKEPVFSITPAVQLKALRMLAKIEVLANQVYDLLIAYYDVP